MSTLLATLAVTTLLPLASAAAEPPPAVVSDPPHDAAHPAGMAYVRIPSHGVLINGVIYTASGAGPHPTMVLLHGFPGNEQNLDLAQAVRRAGFNVLTLHYRGAWGSPGVFTFAHAAEDADAAVAFLLDPATLARFGVDRSRVYVAGHSMGGFMAASAAAHAPQVAGLVMISAWNMAEDGKTLSPWLREEFADDIVPLGGATVEGLARELAQDTPRWDFTRLARDLSGRPVLLIAADDGTGPAMHTLAETLRRAGDRNVGEIHMATDHPFSDHRIALEAAVLDWLAARH
jgi:pimeloyl-ACP methyl ester carboxylesterase